MPTVEYETGRFHSEFIPCWLVMINEHGGESVPTRHDSWAEAVACGNWNLNKTPWVSYEIEEDNDADC